MTAADFAARNHLKRVGARPALPSYLKQAWARRDFVFELAKSRIQASNNSNRLGMLWVVIKPTLNALMYGAIFGILQGANKPEDFPVFVVIGVFLFEFFSTSMTQGAKSITGNAALVQSLSFPRISLPVSTVVQNLLQLAPMLGVMFVYCLVLGTAPQWSWLLVLPLVALFTLFNTGVALICARLTVHLRDITQILPLVTRVLFYTSGVLFSVEKIFTAYPALVAVYDFHPLYQVLSIARGCIMEGHSFPAAYWLFFSIWSVVLFVAGVVFFWVAEERYGRGN
ncbi:transport permease protein [Zafaria cholistanensis]|uniref:Transport permease protein n=1 Tax=Zafaria cholistanensis TaxID=1682741 RepID=A0A5A7NQ32_9MICC|nr:ABC transporter permease [Zafaria cholistanensis]GER21918.1 transport permease protein [Zafaria cholistanensis]